MTPADPWQWALVVSGVGLVYVLIGLGEGWLVRAVQATIILAIIGSDILWHWRSLFNNNGYVVGLVAIGAAWILTVPPVKLLDWYRYRFRKGTAIVPLPAEDDGEYPDYSVPQTVEPRRDPEAVKAELRRMVGMDKR